MSKNEKIKQLKNIIFPVEKTVETNALFHLNNSCIFKTPENLTFQHSVEKSVETFIE